MDTQKTEYAELDNRIGILEQRIDMLEDQTKNMKKIIISEIIDVLKIMR